MRRSIRAGGIGVLGLLAIAGGTVVTATPTWAGTTFTLVNEAQAYDWFGKACGSQVCSLYPISPWGPTLLQTYYPASETGGYSAPAEYAAQVGAPGSSATYSFVFEGAATSSGVPTMTCSLPGNGPVRAEPDYATNTCTAAPWTTKAAGDAVHARISSNKALVRNGKAKVRITSYSRKKFKVNEKLVLRNAAGKVIGSTTARVTTGKRTYLKVPLPPNIRKKVRTGRSVVVIAHLKHADHILGSGHKTTRLVLTKS